MTWRTMSVCDCSSSGGGSFSYPALVTCWYPTRERPFKRILPAMLLYQANRAKRSPVARERPPVDLMAVHVT